MKVDIPQRAGYGIENSRMEQTILENQGLAVSTIGLACMNEKQFATLVESLPQLVWMTRPDGRAIYFNQQWLNYTGLTLEESCGNGWSTPFHPDDRQRAQDAWQKATQQDVPYSLECRLRRTDGVYRWWLIRGVPRRNAKGEIIKWFGTCTDIEKIKVTEAELRESEAMLKESQRIALLGSYVLDITSDRWRSTEVLDMIFGIDAAYERTTAGWAGLIHPDDRAMMVDYFSQEVIGRHQPFDKQYRIVRSSDQAERWLHGQGQLEFDTRGHPVKMLGTILDITERKRAEEARRATEGLHRSVLAAMAEGIVVQAADGAIIDCNQSAEKIMGLSREQILGRGSLDPSWQAVDANGRPFPGEQHPAMVSLRTGQPCHGVTMGLRLPGGMQKWISINAEPMFNSGETSPYAVVISFSDVTERHQALEALRQLSERLTLATRAGSVGIWEYDVSDKRLVWDEQMFLLYGVTPDAMSLAHDVWLAGVHPDDRQSRDDGIKAAWRGEKDYDTEFRVVWPDGSIHNIRAIASVQRDASGRALRMVGTNWDITASRQSKAALLETNRQLAAATAAATELAGKADLANRAKSEFLANMSHEIRTPMNGILGMTHMLLASTLSDEQREYAQMAHTSGEVLLKLTNDILDLSKIEAGNLDMEILDFSLPDLLHELGEALNIGASDKGLQFRCTLAPDIPESLRGDPNRLRQVLLNLAANAIKFTSHGSVTVRAELVAASAGGVVIRFVVCDTGIGIPADKHVLLFNKFSQVDPSTTRHYGGTGLGLAISKQLVELMGGEIGVSSVVGHGSEFWFTACFTMGLRSISAAPPPPTPPPVSPAPMSGHWSTLRVLLAEDNPINQKVAVGFLRNMGLSADVVTDGLAAVEAVARTSYDLVLMDVQMPGMDGLDATRLIRSAHVGAFQPKLPIIAMTANAMQGDRETCLVAGMNDYLPKPITPASLALMLERWLPARLDERKRN